jgi:hypothetical protein
MPRDMASRAFVASTSEVEEETDFGPRLTVQLVFSLFNGHSSTKPSRQMFHPVLMYTINTLGVERA